jgi:hypothetical protein
MIKKPKKKYPPGYSEEVPEGILGLTDADYDDMIKGMSEADDISTAIAAAAAKGTHRKKGSKTSKDKAKDRSEKPSKSKSNKGHKDQKDHAVYSKDSRARPQQSKVKAKKARVSKSKLRSRVLPDFSINYEEPPAEVAKVPVANAVTVPDTLLKAVIDQTDDTTRKLSNLILRGLAPSIMSYEAASSYVQAAMADGLKMDVEMDKGVLDVVKEMTRLDVMYFFLRRLKLPKQYKALYMKAMIDKMADYSIRALEKSDKTDAHRKYIKEIEAYVVRRSDRAKEHGASSYQQRQEAQKGSDGKPKGGPKKPSVGPGVKRSRHE